MSRGVKKLRELRNREKSSTGEHYYRKIKNHKT